MTPDCSRRPGVSSVLSYLTKKIQTSRSLFSFLSSSLAPAASPLSIEVAIDKTSLTDRHHSTKRLTGTSRLPLQNWTRPPQTTNHDRYPQTQSRQPVLSALGMLPMYDESSEAIFRHKARAKSWAYDTSAHDLRVLPVYFTSDAPSPDALSPSPSSGYQSTSSSASGQVTSSSSSQPPQMFHCPEHDCFRKFNRRYTLIEHLKTHTGEKPHVCPAAGCRKRFTTSGNLSRHKRLHGFIQPLECPVDGCMSTFPSNNKLEKHMKYHLGSPVHVCKIGTCGKTFSTMGNLNRHVKHHHNLEVHENDTESSSRGSFSGTNSISSSSSTRGSFASEFHFQSPTAADDDVYYANNTPRGKPGGGQSIIRSPAPLSSTMGSGSTGIPFPRIYPASVHANGNPERVWSSETLLDSLSTIFDEDEPQQQQHHSVSHHHQESLQYQHHNQQQQRQQYHQYAPMQPSSFPASPTLLDDMIHFHVTNFQC